MRRFRFLAILAVAACSAQPFGGAGPHPSPLAIKTGDTSPATPAATATGAASPPMTTVSRRPGSPSAPSPTPRRVTPVDATPYLTLEPPHPCPGGQVTIRGGGFSCTPIQLVLGSIHSEGRVPTLPMAYKLGEAEVDPVGRFTMTVTLAALPRIVVPNPHYPSVAGDKTPFEPALGKYYRLHTLPCEELPRTYLIMCGYFSPAPSRALL